MINRCWTLLLILSIILSACGSSSARPLLKLDPALAQAPLDKVIRAQLERPKLDTYAVYALSRQGADLKLDYRTWRGLLLFPNVAKAGRPSTYRLLDHNKLVIPDERSRSVVTEWYKNLDGSLSKLFVNAKNQPIGALTVNTNGSKSLVFDLDGDQRLDFLAIALGFDKELIFVNEARGLKFLNDLMAGRDPRCGIQTKAAPVQFDPRLMLSCGIGSRDFKFGGGLITGGLDAYCEQEQASGSIPRAPADDPADDNTGVFDQIYENINRDLGILGFFAVVTEISINATTLALVGAFEVLTTPSHAGESEENIQEAIARHREEHPSEVIYLEEVPISLNTVYLEEIEITGNVNGRDQNAQRPGNKPPRNNQPPIGQENDPEAALHAVCVMRLQQQKRWASLSIQTAENCDNPYRVPVPGSDDRPSSRLSCKDPDANLLGPNAERVVNSVRQGSCGPLAQPRPDGTCAGQHGSASSSGKPGSALISLIGGIAILEACKPEVCNPASR